MQTLFYSEARNNLRSFIDKVCANANEYVITTKDKQSAVLMSYDEYASLKETLYLLSSKTNRERLLESVEQIESASFEHKELDL